MGVMHVHVHTHTNTPTHTQVRPHETINIYHGQPICLMEFFRNASVPKLPYGATGIYLCTGIYLRATGIYLRAQAPARRDRNLSRGLRVHMLTRPHTREHTHTTTHMSARAHAYTFPT